MGEPGASGSGFRFRGRADPRIERGKPELGEGGQEGRSCNRGEAGLGLLAPESHRCRKAKRTAFHSLPGVLCTPSCHSASQSSCEWLLPAPAFLAAGRRCALVGPLLFWATGNGERLKRRTNRSQIAPAGTWRARVTRVQPTGSCGLWIAGAPLLGTRTCGCVRTKLCESAFSPKTRALISLSGWC